MKTIYINNSSIHQLREGIIRTELPDSLLVKISRGNTAFGSNSMFPNIYETSFVEKICNDRFKYVCDELKKMKRIDILKSKDINGAISEIIELCKKEERPFKDKIESLCAKYTINLFDIPEDSISLELNITDEVRIDGHIIQFDKIEDETEYDDIVDAENFKKELDKREIINALNFGYGLLNSSNIRYFVQELYDINPRLPELYRIFNLLNEYSLFVSDEGKMTEQNPMQIGSVEVKLTASDEMPIVKAQGVILPVLLCESIRGLMELFSSHGFPKDIKLTRQIIKRTEYLKAEPWYMRVGPQMWKIVFGQNQNIDSNLIPYLYKRVCNLDIEDFEKFIKNSLAKTNNGKKLMSILMDKAQEDYSSSDSEKMSEPDVDNTIITDNYIRKEEL